MKLMIAFLILANIVLALVGCHCCNNGNITMGLILVSINSMFLGINIARAVEFKRREDESRD